MARKPFAWSYSRLSAFETCARRHQQVDLDKNYKEEEGPALFFGNKLHSAMQKAGETGAPLPDDLARYQASIDAIIALPGTKSYELKLAINEQLEPVAYFATDAWYRGVVDALVINGKRAVAVDWKTGKIKDDTDQLALNAVALFSHYPKLQEITTLYRWLTQPDSNATPPIKYTRDEISRVLMPILPRVKRYRHAYENELFVPSPSGLCRGYCPVKSCEHWQGKKTDAH